MNWRRHYRGPTPDESQRATDGVRSASREPLSRALLALPMVLVFGAVALSPARSDAANGSFAPTGAMALPVGASLALSSKAPVAIDPSAIGWFQLDRRLDGAGSSLGRTLTVGTLGRSTPTATIDLVEDASATPPVGGIVLFRADDGTRSRLVTVSVVDGMMTERASLTDRVSAAVMSADGTVVYYLSAPRNGGRISLWRLPLGSKTGSLMSGDWAVPALGLGTFQLVASQNGQSLIAEFCGDEGCDGRLVDLASGTTSSVSDHELGWVVAVDGHDVYSINHHDALVRTRADGTSTSIATDVAGAIAVVGPKGLTFALIRVGTSVSLSVLDPVAGTERQMRKEPLSATGQMPFDLVGGSADRTAGTTQTNGWLLTTASGRVVSPSGGLTAPLLLSTVNPGSIDLQKVWK